MIMNIKKNNQNIKSIKTCTALSIKTEQCLMF